jgi:hypothetical protein
MLFHHSRQPSVALLATGGKSDVTPSLPERTPAPASPVLRANGYFFNVFNRYMLQDVQKANDAISTQNGTLVCRVSSVGQRRPNCFPCLPPRPTPDPRPPTPDPRPLVSKSSVKN